MPPGGPAPPEPHVDDEEDTLSGLERVPAVDTAVVSAAEIEEYIEQESAQEPEPKKRRRLLLWLLLLLVLAAVAAALILWRLYF
jgi:hypothetical protein